MLINCLERTLKKKKRTRGKGESLVPMLWTSLVKWQVILLDRFLISFRPNQRTFSLSLNSEYIGQRGDNTTNYFQQVNSAF